MSSLAIAASLGAARLVAKSSLLIVVAWCLAGLLRRSSAAARHVVWLTAVVGVLLTPALDRLVVIPVRVLPTETGLAVAARPTADVFVSGANRPISNSASTAPATAPATTVVSSPLTLTTMLASIWVAVALLMLARLAFGYALVRRLARRARMLEATSWTAALDDAARELGIHRVPRLVMSDEVDAAFTFDALSPTIVLPAHANEWPPDRRRSVLLHELAHVRRRDLIGHGVAAIACALSWFNPLIWVAARRLRVESELASDDIVLDAGIRPSAYAQHLLDLVTSMSRRAPMVAVAMARPKDLEGRLIAILDPIRRPPARRAGGMVAGILALCVISIGALTPAPRPHAPPPAAAPTVARDQTVARGQTVARDHMNARGLSSDSRASLLRYGTGGIMNPMMMLLREADSLGLSGAQADSIATLNRRYMVRLSAIWSPVSSYLLSHPDARDEHAASAGIEAQRETTAALLELLPALDDLLTPEQRAKMSAHAAMYLDRHNVEATGVQGVFVPATQLYELRGRGRGG